MTGTGAWGIVLLFVGAALCGQGPRPARAGGGGAAAESAHKGRYKILIVAAPKCADPKLAKLTNPVLSGRKLQAAFERLKYGSDMFPEDNAGRGTAAEVWQWLRAHATAKQTDLAVLVLVGHGGYRKGQRVFLTCDATSAAGGLDVDEINDHASREGWPLVIVVDACGTGLGRPLVGADAPRRPEKAARGVFRGSLGKTDYVQRTQLYSTLPGRLAHDKADLVSALAEGLEIDRKTGRFKADPWSRTPADGTGTSAGVALSLHAWFRYAVTKVMEEHRMDQYPVVYTGRPGLETLLATPAGPPAHAVKIRGISLLERWHPQHGDYKARPGKGGYVWVVSPGARGTGQPWIGGFVHLRGDGFDTTGKTLFAEVQVTFSPLAGSARSREVSVGLDTKHVDMRNLNHWLTRNGQKARCVVQTNWPTWCKIPLAPGKKLNYFAPTDLPRGCVLVLRQLCLADDKQDLPAQAQTSIDLMPRWWPGDRGQVANALRFWTETIEGRRVVSVAKGPGWMGGIIGPPVWVTGSWAAAPRQARTKALGDVVEVVIENTSRKEAYVLVEIKEAYEELGRRNLVLPPGRSKQVIPVDRNGLADYLAVTKPTADLRFRSIRLKAAPPTVVSPE